MPFFGVKGILVVNYVEWMFLKIQNDKIERDKDTLNFEKLVATVGFWFEWGGYCLSDSRKLCWMDVLEKSEW